MYSERHAGDDDAKRERGRERCAFENEEIDDDDGCTATRARDDDDACVGWG